MSTLVIEGGHRLHGRLDVEGNKNAALPLIAACLLTEQTCVLSNVPRIARRRGDVPAAARSRRRGRRHRHDHAAHLLHGGHERRARPRAGRPPARVGAADGSAAGASRPRASSRRRAATFPTRRSIRTHLDALRHMGVRIAEAPGHTLEAPDGLKAASFYLEEASVTGTETALLAAAAAPGRTRDSSCRVRTACGGALRVPARDGRRRRGRRAARRSRVEGCARLRGAERTLWGDYIEAGSWAVVARDHRRHDRGRRHAARGHGSGRAPC